MFVCNHCGKECKNANSFKNHVRCCPKNPNRKYTNNKIGKKGGNQHTKGTAKPITEETRNKLAEASRKKIWTKEMRDKHSESMKLAVSRNPNSYSSGNRGRVKQIECDGMKFHGRWELYFYQWCKRNGIKVNKCDEWFDYEWCGQRKYLPDFKLPEYDCYVEVKGYKTERDDAKWNQFKGKLLIVDKKDIPKLLDNTYTLGL